MIVWRRGSDSGWRYTDAAGYPHLIPYPSIGESV